MSVSTLLRCHVHSRFSLSFAFLIDSDQSILPSLTHCAYLNFSDRVEFDSRTQWRCPECTLINSLTDSRCQACDYTPRSVSKAKDMKQRLEQERVQKEEKTRSQIKRESKSSGRGEVYEEDEATEPVNVNSSLCDLYSSLSAFFFPVNFPLSILTFCCVCLF